MRWMKGSVSICPDSYITCKSKMIVIGTLTFLFFATLATCEERRAPETTAPKRTLLFVAELCRHGDRSPLVEFPSDELPASKWPEGIGKLTAIGMRAHYDLGTRLRARYVDSGFLPSSYHPDDIYVRSTDIDRTLVSAISQLAGLYPPGTATNSDVRIRYGKDPLHENEGGLPHLFQPIPVHSESKWKDSLLLPGNVCPRHQMLMEGKMRDPKFLEVVRKNADFLEQARKISGFTGKEFTLLDLDHLSDTWTCFAAHSVPLPKDATPDIVGKARNLSNWLLTFGNEGLDVNRMRAGTILYEIKKHMAAAVHRDKGELSPELKKEDYGKKFVLFSAHDTTVAATLAALRSFNGVYPPYNSTLIWELFKENSGELSVRVEYNNEALILPGCLGEYCPLKTYLLSTEARTVPGVARRDVECMTGWRRLAAMAYYSFSRSSEDKLANFGPGIDDDPPRPHGSAVILVLAMLTVAVVGLVGGKRIRARYKGYTPAASDPRPVDEYGVMAESVSGTDRRILM